MVAGPQSQALYEWRTYMATGRSGSGSGVCVCVCAVQRVSSSEPMNSLLLTRVLFFYRGPCLEHSVPFLQRQSAVKLHVTASV